MSANPERDDSSSSSNVAFEDIVRGQGVFSDPDQAIIMPRANTPYMCESLEMHGLHEMAGYGRNIALEIASAGGSLQHVELGCKAMSRVFGENTYAVEGRSELLVTSNQHNSLRLVPKTIAEARFYIEEYENQSEFMVPEDPGDLVIDTGETFTRAILGGWAFKYVYNNDEDFAIDYEPFVVLRNPLVSETEGRILTGDWLLRLEDDLMAEVVIYQD